MTLTRDQFRERRRPLPKVKVAVPELGDDAEVWVTKFNARMRDKFEEVATGGNVGGKVNLANVRARVVTILCVDEDGKPLFTEADADWLGECDTDAIQRIIDAGFKLNGIGAGALEDAVGN
jgi:hypothetical protein